MGTTWGKQANNFSSEIKTTRIQKDEKETSNTTMFKKTNDEDKGINLENPGSFEKIHNLSREVSPNVFEGIKIILNNNINRQFTISHSVNIFNEATPKGFLGIGTQSIHVETGGYKFGTAYCGNKQFNSAETFPILVGDIDSSGNATATIMHQFTPQLRTCFSGQFSAGQSNTQLGADFVTNTFTAYAGIVQINENMQQHIFGHYLQAITPSLALGCSISYNNSEKTNNDVQRALVTAGIKYKFGSFDWSSTCNEHEYVMCMHKQGSKNIRIAAEFKVNRRNKEAIGSIGYQVKLPSRNFIFRGMVDTSFNVGSVIEKQFTPMPILFSLSTLLNHKRNQLNVGFGFTMEH